MAGRPEPEVAPEEREQFGRKGLQHEDDDQSSGPASEPDVRSDAPLPPDTGALKR